MRRIAMLIALTLMLAGGLIAVPAAAGPAQPYQQAGCVPLDNLEICYQAQGVVKQTTSPSGTALFLVTGQYCSQTYLDGVLIDDYCSKSQVTILQKDVQTQVAHNRVDSEHSFELDGTIYTCTTSYNVVYANGEYRHQDIELACTPPLV